MFARPVTVNARSNSTPKTVGGTGARIEHRSSRANDAELAAAQRMYASCTRASWRQLVLCALLAQLFQNGAFTQGTSLHSMQAAWRRITIPSGAACLQTSERIASWVLFCGALLCGGCVEDRPGDMELAVRGMSGGAVVERATSALVPMLHALSLSQVDRSNREANLARALAGTIVNVWHGFAVSGRVGPEPTIVDMVMCVCLSCRLSR